MNANPGKKVAFVVESAGSGWLGGMNYLRNLVAAIRAQPDRGVEPVIVCGSNLERECRENFPGCEILKSSLFDRKSLAWYLRKVVARGTGHDWMFERFLLRHGVSLVSHYMPWGKRSRIASISWIADFQHVRLPHLFNSEELRFRDRMLGRMCGDSTLVLLSSESAKKDLMRFAPAAQDHVEVLRFSVNPFQVPDPPSREELAKKYDLPEVYFHLPNQYWIHKNHGVVIEALRILKQNGSSISVISTGAANDSRAPGHFEELMNRVERYGLREEYRTLGILPYADIVGLMTHAKAVINPSFFEGWSSSVEEARALRRTIILSDIDVHREQAPPRAHYFDPESPEELAHVMREVFLQPLPTGDDADVHGEAVSRWMEFGGQFQKIALSAIARGMSVNPSAFR